MCGPLSFGPWGGEQDPAWGPVMVVGAFQTCAFHLSPRRLGRDLPDAGGWLQAVWGLPGWVSPPRWCG